LGRISTDDGSSDGARVPESGPQVGVLQDFQHRQRFSVRDALYPPDAIGEQVTEMLQVGASRIGDEIVWARARAHVLDLGHPRQLPSHHRDRHSAYANREVYFQLADPDRIGHADYLDDAEPL
jgi:hypothetical protein